MRFADMDAHPGHDHAIPGYAICNGASVHPDQFRLDCNAVDYPVATHQHADGTVIESDYDCDSNGIVCDWYIECPICGASITWLEWR